MTNTLPFPTHPQLQWCQSRLLHSDQSTVATTGATRPPNTHTPSKESSSTEELDARWGCILRVDSDSRHCRCRRQVVSMSLLRYNRCGFRSTAPSLRGQSGSSYGVGGGTRLRPSWLVCRSNGYAIGGIVDGRQIGFD